MPDSSGEQLQEPEQGRRHRRLMEAFSSPDSYGLVLLLILATYGLSAALAGSWAASLVLAVQIATVWVTLRASRARRSVRVVADVALAVAALAAVANLFLHDQIHGGIVASWVSCLLYLIAPVLIAVVTAYLTMEGVKYAVASRKAARATRAKVTPAAQGVADAPA